MVGEPLLEAIGLAWDRAGLSAVLRGGYQTGDPPEPGQPAGAAVQRPYLRLEAPGEAPEAFTNGGQYDKGTFDLTVVADTLEELAPLLLAVANANKRALREGWLADLGPNSGGAGVRMLRPGSTRPPAQALNYWSVTQEWVFRTGKPQ